MKNIYDDKTFFEEYAKMTRSQMGLKGAGEWHQLQHFFPDMKNKKILDLGCGYGWHCKYAAAHGAKEILGIDGSHRMIGKAAEINNDPVITYKVCNLEEYDYPSILMIS